MSGIIKGLSKALETRAEDRLVQWLVAVGCASVDRRRLLLLLLILINFCIVDGLYELIEGHLAVMNPSCGVHLPHIFSDI